MEMVSDIGTATDAIAAAEESPLQEIESLCMRCGENGTTRLLLTRIPHFREIALISFECSHCSERNNEVQFAGQLQPRGCCHTLKVPEGQPEALNRQLVKSDSATVRVPELDFEVPPAAQRGALSTVEGVLVRAFDELQALQEERRRVNPLKAKDLDAFLAKLKGLAAAERAFTFILDDPAGNSFIENPFAPTNDPLLSVRFYERSPEQQAALGFLTDQPAVKENNRDAPEGMTTTLHGAIGAQVAHRTIAQGNSEAIATALFKYSAPEEVMIFPATCAACGARCETRMYVTNIPYFKEVIVMSSVCDTCGYRSSELKPGGSIPSKGKKISVQILKKEDLSRDVIKSESAAVIVPELELELAPGTLGGLVTTVEGLLMQISESLKRMHGFSIGDSADDWKHKKWQEFNLDLKGLLEIQRPWTLILDDGLANSFIAPVTEIVEDDKQLKVEEYERLWEQNEELGLNDMDTTVADEAYKET